MRYLLDRFAWKDAPDPDTPLAFIDEETDPEYAESIIDPEEDE